MEEASGPPAEAKARVVSTALTWRQRPPAQDEVKHRFHKVSLVSGARLEAPSEETSESSHRREEVNGFAVREPGLIQVHRDPQNSGPFIPGWGPTRLEEAGHCPGHTAPWGRTQGRSSPHLEGCLCL